jgi:tetratricopeptide (TPR) repeat protein/transcriptional regulator with XRE-family HTH domain
MTQSNQQGPLNVKLQQARLAHHWSQQKAAILLGTTKVTVGRWERGETQPGPYYQKQLCQLYGKSEEELGLRCEPVSQEIPGGNTNFPEALPTTVPATYDPLPLWTVPHRRNPFFTGREYILRQLHTVLTQKQSILLSQSSTLTGLGGIGKTQTAIEYAYSYATEYSAVFWISAETSESLVASFVTIAELLKLPERQEQQRIVSAVTRWLAHQHNWLLIFDNVEDPGLVKGYLPPTSTGSLIFTSRRQALDFSAHLLYLETLTSEEGLQFFLHRSRLLDPAASSLDLLTSEEETAARAIVAALDSLPLALDQAAAYLEATQCAPSDYLRLLQTSFLQLLDERESHADHPLSVTRTFHLIFRQLESTNPDAAEVLVVCAFLAPEAIPETFFLAGATRLGPTFEALAADPLRLQAACKALLNYSLLQRSPATRTMTIHRLVQAVLKAELAEAVRRVWETRVLAAMSQVFPAEEAIQADYWSVCELLLPHALACITLGEPEKENEEKRILLMSHIATYLTKRAQYADAEELFEQALRKAEQVLGPRHPLIAYPLHGLADVCLVQGKYEEAEPLFERTIRVRERTLGPDHLLLATSLNRFGVLFREQGKYKQAETLCMQALHIWERTLGPEHLQLARPLYNLGALYFKQGEYGHAEMLYQRALCIQERSLGSEHPQVALSLESLAILYAEQEKYLEAEPLFRRALGIRESILGSEHPKIGLSLHNLAEFYRLQGKYSEAEPLFYRSLHVYEQTLGQDHRDLAWPLDGLGSLLRDQGKYEQAEPLYQRALHLREQALGPEHPDLAETLHNLATLREAQVIHEEARDLYKRALRIRERALGPAHSQTQDTRAHLARLLQTLDQTGEAELSTADLLKQAEKSVQK